MIPGDRGTSDAAERQERTTPAHLPTGRLALTAAITLVVGTGLLLLAAAPSAGSELAVFGLAGLLGTGLVAPLLGLLAFLTLWPYRCRMLRDMVDGPAGGQVLKLARRLLIAAATFAGASLLAAILCVWLAEAYPIPPFMVLWHGVLILVALGLGWIASGWFARAPAAKTSCLAARGVVGVALVAMVLTAFQTGIGNYLLQRFDSLSKTPTFVGDSNSLEHTLIVPTLDDPRPEGRNVIWCSSFQLAWNEVRDGVIGAPPAVVGAEEVAARLNAGQASGADLQPGSCYAMAGRFKDGVIERIETDMAARFPKQSVPDFRPFATVSDGILAYAYLTANVPFTRPFPQLGDRLTFTDGGGDETMVRGFGLGSVYHTRFKKVREQVDVLYAGWPDPNRAIISRMEFALDLCKHSAPYQVVVAVIEPAPSLSETVERLERKIALFQQETDYESRRILGDYDDLQVPEMFWDITHRFEELMGHVVTNAAPAMPIVEAMQQIRFRLDRSGAALESASVYLALGMSRQFLCNRPFLIYMKKRDAKQPFFVMWVDNAELLTRK